MGGAIGWERRSADRPAGVRTMALVSLGSCFFAISSQLGFKSSTMGWDASRVTAAIPSGVGFLGAGLIWKGTSGTGKDQRHEVHGLTTAAGVWLSAAIGVGCGGRLYFVSVYSCILVTTILRYGPQIYFDRGVEGDGGDNDEAEDDLDSKSSRTTYNCDNGRAMNGGDEKSENQNKRRAGADGSSVPLHRLSQGIGTTSMEGVRVALVDAKELKLFEAWKKERDGALTKSNGTPNDDALLDNDDLSCSESSQEDASQQRRRDRGSSSLEMPGMDQKDAGD